MHLLWFYIAPYGKDKWFAYDYKPMNQHLNGHVVDKSNKDNDNTTQPQQSLLTDTISAEPCPKSSPQTDRDILELLQDSVPRDHFLENSQGNQESMLQPPITPEQQPLSPDTLSLSPASPLLCFLEKIEELVYAGTKLSLSFTANPQKSTKSGRPPNHQSLRAQLALPPPLRGLQPLL